MYLAFFAFITGLIIACDGHMYRNYALLLGTPRNPEELAYFNSMEKLYNVSFWKRPSVAMKSVHFMISPMNYVDLMVDSLPKKIYFKTLIDDVQSAFDKQTVKRYFRRQMDGYDWAHYYCLSDIYDWLKDIASNHPKEVELVTIGKSVENRDIMAVKIKINQGNETRRNRLKVMVEGGIHGREWISPAFVTYMINAILNVNKNSSKSLQRVVPLFDWYFVPVLNPDGYFYSQTKDRIWKKNRVGGYGVDLNRNYGILFGKNGAQTIKTSDEYCGKEAFSEPESAAMAAFTRDNSDNLEYYLSFHSYGQAIIIPYAFTKQHEDNYNETKLYARLIARELLRKHNVNYIVGNNYETMGVLASGVSADWVKRAMNATFVLTIKLPDTGVYGFALPADQILPVCRATLDGLLSMLDPRLSGEITKMRDEHVNGAVLGEPSDIIVVLFCNLLLYLSVGY